jgi:hypothetical protein
VKSERTTSDNEIASTTNQSDIAFSYGGGGGVKVKVYQNEKDDGKLLSVLIDLRVRYIFGGKAEYLKEGSVRIQGGRAYYDTYKSKTDLLLGQLGVSVVF